MDESHRSTRIAFGPDGRPEPAAASSHLELTYHAGGRIRLRDGDRTLDLTLGDGGRLEVTPDGVRVTFAALPPAAGGAVPPDASARPPAVFHRFSPLEAVVADPLGSEPPAGAAPRGGRPPISRPNEPGGEEVTTDDGDDPFSTTTSMCPAPPSGGADAPAPAVSLADRMRRHAESIIQNGRPCRPAGGGGSAAGEGRPRSPSSVLADLQRRVDAARARRSPGAASPIRLPRIELPAPEAASDAPAPSGDARPAPEAEPATAANDGPARPRIHTRARARRVRWDNVPGQLTLWPGFGDEPLASINQRPDVREAIELLRRHQLRNPEEIVLQCGPAAPKRAVDHYERTRKRTRYRKPAGVIAKFCLDAAIEDREAAARGGLRDAPIENTRVLS